jgi:hypothetical protein
MIHAQTDCPLITSPGLARHDSLWSPAFGVHGPDGLEQGRYASGADLSRCPRILLTSALLIPNIADLRLLRGDPDAERIEDMLWHPRIHD